MIDIIYGSRGTEATCTNQPLPAKSGPIGFNTRNLLFRTQHLTRYGGDSDDGEGAQIHLPVVAGHGDLTPLLERGSPSSGCTTSHAPPIFLWRRLANTN